MRHRWFATTVSGMEDLAAEEVREIAGVEAAADVGKVFFEGSVEDVALLNYSSTMLHRVFLTLAQESIESLEDVYRVARSIDYSWLISPEQSFAVRAERHAKHLPFTSIDAAAAVGRAVIESFREARGVRLRVNLDEPDLEFYCLLRDSEMILGLDTTGPSLHRRYYRVYHHRAALQPAIAAGMLRISGWRREESLLDPMCGGGTIPIEAALAARRIPPGLRRGAISLERLVFVKPEELERARRRAEERMEPGYRSEITGSDASPKSIDGARRNAEAAGVSDTVRLMVADALHIEDWLDRKPAHVLVNPPYGLRMGVRNPQEFYRRFLRSLRAAAPEAKLTAIVSKPVIFTRALTSEGYQPTQTRQINYGRIRATIISAQP